MRRMVSTMVILTLVLSLFSFSNFAMAASSQDVVISEVAWMGTTYSYNDEWIELYNNTSSDVSLDGWTLSATDGTPVISLSGTVPAQSHFLLERIDDTSVPGVAADLIYSGSMGNTIEVLELRDASNTLIDSVDSWYGGDNNSKSSMERVDVTASGTTSSSWGTSTVAYDGGLGTPCNSSAPTLVISEIAWMGTTYSYNDEWIELFNNTAANINLTGWTLNATDETPAINLSGTVPANGYYLLERTDDTSVPGISANLIYSGSLGNTTETLELKNASAVLIDTVDAWYGGDNDSKATMERVDTTVGGTTSSNWVTATATYDGGLGTPSQSSESGTGSGSGSGGTGSGSWTEGNFEIHHINVGQGDSTLVVGPTGKSLLIDASESYWNSSADAEVIGPYVESVLGDKNLDYVLITHFHLDHIGYVGYGGLWHLVEQQGFTIGNTIQRDYNSYLGTTSGTFNNWKLYSEGVGNSKINPIIAMEGTSQIDLGTGVTVDIVATDGNGVMLPGDFSAASTPPSENDYSIALNISYGDFDEFIAGDISGEYTASSFGYKYHDIETSLAKEVGDVDVFRVNHHGSDHSNNATLVGQLDPEVSIISVGENSYGHPRQSVVDRVLATSDLYLTERGDTSTNIGSGVVSGHTVIKTTDGITYTVNGTSYTATEPSRTDKDGDGYFAEVDPNDKEASEVPQPVGGLDPVYQ